MPVSNKKLKCCTGLSVGGAVFFLALGIGGPFFLNYMLEQGIRKQLVVTGPDSESYEDFTTERTAVNPMYRNMYLWNLTNPDEFLEGGVPNVEEIGPFCYREHRNRFNISWSDDKNIVYYDEQRFYIFHPELSCPTCDPYTVNITTINVPEQSVQNTLRLKAGGFATGIWGELAQAMLMAGTGELPLVTRPVHEILWGYDDPLLDTLSKLIPSTPSRFQGLQENVTSIEEALALQQSSIYTGNDDINKVSHFHTFRNMSTLPYWVNGTWATVLRGSDGTQHKLNVQTDDIMYSFSQDVCLTVNLTYVTTYTLKGIELYRYGIPRQALANATQYPGNSAIYNFMPSGLTNVTSARRNAPIFLSKPHFLDADPIYRINVTGMNPVQDLHDTRVDVEPIMGSTMNAQQRLQINIKLHPLIGKYSTMPQVVLPVAWVEETSTVTDKLAKKFRNSVYLVKTMQAVSMWLGLVMGALLIMISGALGYILRRRRKRGGFTTTTRLLKDGGTGVVQYGDTGE